MSITEVFLLFGGLGLFLFGMKLIFPLRHETYE